MSYEDTWKSEIFLEVQIVNRYTVSIQILSLRLELIRGMNECDNSCDILLQERERERKMIMLRI